MLQCFNSKQKNDPVKLKPAVKSINTVRENLQQIIINQTIHDVKDDSQYLYVILPYFNFCGSKSRKRLFIEFINKYNKTPGIRICIGEAKLNGKTYELPQSMSNIYIHIGVVTNDCIWIKENLINLVINKLPVNWKYVAWIDADLTFLNTNWVNDTISKLQSNDVIQLFQTCINMGPNGESFKIDKSFCYMHKTSKYPWTQKHTYGFWHPGYAWACTKDAYNCMGKLIDYAILGAGDHHMALALIGKVRLSHPNKIHDNYKNRLIEFEERCIKNKLKLDYINGSIIHHWHGRLQDRKYIERWNILVSMNYDPLSDLYITSEKYMQLTNNGKRLSKPLQCYFNDRNEDNTELH
jgi:hypothetical protein